MPIISIKEAAEKCSKTPKDIHVYISRGKLIKRKDSTIDTENTTNKLFFLKYGVQEKKAEEIEVIKEIPNQPKISPKPSKQSKKKQLDDDENTNVVYSAANLDALRSEKLEQEIIALKLKNQRLEGEVVETDLIQQTTFEIINAFRSNLLIAAKSVLRTNMSDLEASNDVVTRAISDLEVLFNSHTSEAIENVKQAILKVL